MTEVWDIYDENRKPLHKTHKRGTVLNSGEYHLVVDIWVVNRDGLFLIDKRHPNKHLGGYWEISGGAVISGENSKLGAIRELEEELGIKASMDELTLIHSIRLEDRFVDTYIIRMDVDISDLVLQEGEVTEAKFVSITELDEIVNHHLFACETRYKMYRDILKTFIDNKNAS